MRSRKSKEKKIENLNAEEEERREDQMKLRIRAGKLKREVGKVKAEYIERVDVD